MPRSKGRTLLASSAAAVLALAVLSLTLRLDRVDLQLPLNYLADANIFLLRAKTIVEGHWSWWNPRLGVPFGADFHDFPMTVTFDSSMMWLLSRFTHSAPLIVNLDWMIGIALTAALAAFAFVKLDFSLTISVSCGTIFALLPYVYFRATHHLHCLYYAIPLVALAAIEIVRGRWRRIPWYAWIGCVLAALSYAYTAFFAVFVFLAAGLLAWIKFRNFRVPILALALAGTVSLLVLIDLSPALRYWARNGANARMIFKSPAETELYGLKIRYLVTPVPDHPIPLFRWAETRLRAADYPQIPNENEAGRLGTFGSIGFFYLLIFGGAAMLGKPGTAAELLGPCAGLTLLCILLATVGGFSDLFSALVSPEIRCYTRIFPFIGFFCVLAVATLLRRLDNRLPPIPRVVVFAAITVLAGFDQAVPSRAFDHRQDLYKSDDEFVRQIETVLPAGSEIFQLPYLDFPNEPPTAKLTLNDPLRPYLHSSKYRWSAAAVSGTTAGEWNRLAAALPIPDLLRALCQRGFTGLWLDQEGYNPGASPAQAIAQELGAAPIESPDHRFVFFDLRNYAAAQRPRSDDPVQVLFERGFYYEERGDGHVWHWSLRRGRVTLVNPLDTPRKITLSMKLQSADQKPHTVQIAHDGQVDSATTGTSYQRAVNLSANAIASFDLTCSCPGVRPPTGGRVLYFFVSDLAATP